MTIDLKDYEANILAKLIHTAILDMSDWSTYDDIERAKIIRDKVYFQMINAGATINEEFVPKF